MGIGTIGKKLIVVVAWFGALALAASSALAQGCALCYMDAAASGPQTQAALRHGILVLLFPPMVIFAGLYFLLYRRRNVHRESLEEASVSAPASSGQIPEIILHLN
jgi:hypothetical protein